MNTDEYEKWTDLIGQFIVLFAHIEFYVIDALLQFTDAGYEKYKNQQFKKRLSKLDTIVFKISHNKANEKRLQDVIAELKILANTRNLIAHNPFQMSLESIFNDNLSLEIRSFRDQEKVITRQELENDLKRLAKAHDTLYNELGVASFYS